MSDEPRMYGSNSCCKGTPEDPELCIQSVWQRRAWRDYQCTRKRGHGPGGLYCKQHGKSAEEREAYKRRLEQERAEQGQRRAEEEKRDADKGRCDMSEPDMMAHLRALPLGLRGMGVGDPDDGGRIEAADVVKWAIGEIERLRLTDAERDAMERLCDAANDIIADDKRSGGCHWEEDAAAVAVVRGLLERHAR